MWFILAVCVLYPEVVSYVILQLVCSFRNENCLSYCVLHLGTRLWFWVLHWVSSLVPLLCRVWVEFFNFFFQFDCFEFARDCHSSWVYMCSCSEFIVFASLSLYSWVLFAGFHSTMPSSALWYYCSYFFVVGFCAVILFWWCRHFFFEQSFLLIMSPASMWVTFVPSYLLFLLFCCRFLRCDPSDVVVGVF